MALSADALTTVATVLDEIDQDDGDAKVRARVERYINAASSLARRICGRQLTYAAGIVEKKHGHGGVRLLLDRTPIVAVASVVVADTTLDAADHEVEDAAVGFLFRAAGWPDTSQVQRGPSEHLAPGTEEPTIVVTYSGGWVSPAHATLVLPRTLPEDLEDAVVQLVATRWHARGKDLRVVGATFEKSSYTYGGVPVPAEVLGVLSQYAYVPNA